MPRTIAAVLVGAIFLLGAWAVLVGPPGTSADSRRRQQLEARREKLYQQLISFDAGRRAGQDRSGPLQARRESLIGQLERIYADLDTLEGGSGGSPA